jgi:hypothetical protein
MVSKIRTGVDNDLKFSGFINKMLRQRLAISKKKSKILNILEISNFHFDLLGRSLTFDFDLW